MTIPSGQMNVKIRMKVSGLPRFRLGLMFIRLGARLSGAAIKIDVSLDK